MKKTIDFKRTIALVLCIALTISFGGFSSFAVTADEWSTFFSDYSEGYGRALMSPGKDDSERNFSWYSEKGTKSCYVAVSENEDMSSAEIFNGKTSHTPEGDCVNKVTVTGLKENRTYFYKCVTPGAKSEISSFKTIDGDNFTAMYVTDIHVTYDDTDLYEDPLEAEAGNVNDILSAAVNKGDIDLLISAGDQASYGLRSEYTSLLASPLMGSIPFALCVGNHDRKGFDYKYFNNNPNRYKKGIHSYIAEDYWYVKGDVLFLVFDSNCFAAKSHRAFAADAIAKNPDVKWKVASFHHDMYGIMSEKRMTYSEDYLRPIFGEICDEYGIDLVLTGHTHRYSMSNAVFDRKSTDSIKDKDSITDAKGTIYMVSGSINHPRSEPDEVFDENIGYYYLTDEIIYNILDFSEDSIIIKSYALGEDEPFRTFTINKTSANGGHPDYVEKSEMGMNDLLLEFKAFFEEFGIMFKVLFKKSEILNMQK